MTANVMAAQGAKVSVNACRVKYRGEEENEAAADDDDGGGEASKSQWDAWAKRHNKIFANEGGGL